MQKNLPAPKVRKPRSTSASTPSSTASAPNPQSSPAKTRPNSTNTSSASQPPGCPRTTWKSPWSRTSPSPSGSWPASTATRLAYTTPPCPPANTPWPFTASTSPRLASSEPSPRPSPTCNVTAKNAPNARKKSMTTQPTRSKWAWSGTPPERSEEHTSELQSPCNLVCRLLLEKKKKRQHKPKKAMTVELGELTD